MESQTVPSVLLVHGGFHVTCQNNSYPLHLFIHHFIPHAHINFQKNKILYFIHKKSCTIFTIHINPKLFTSFNYIQYQNAKSNMYMSPTKTINEVTTYTIADLVQVRSRPYCCCCCCSPVPTRGKNQRAKHIA